MEKLRFQEDVQRPHFEAEEPRSGYKEMVETMIMVNGVPKTETSFQEEEPIPEIEEATKQSLAYLELGGLDLTTRTEMPKFFKFDIFSNSTKEALEKTRDYLDYLQAEAAAEAKTAEPQKTPKEVLKGE